MNQHVKDEGDLRRYYSQIPHLADDEMDPYEMRLYVHYKRVCGQGGECHETTETTATKTKMKPRKVQMTRQELANKGWLRLERKGPRGKERIYITLIDRWNDNYQRYSKEATSTPAPDAPVHVVHPVPLHDMHSTPAPDAPKRKTIEEKPKRQEETAPANGARAPASHQCIIDLYVKELTYTPQNMGKEARAAKWLAQQEYTPDQVIACYRHLKRDKFWRDKFVSLQKIADEIAEFSRSHRAAAPTQTYRKPTQAEIEAAKAAPIVEV